MDRALALARVHARAAGEPAQGLLRRLDHARRGAQGTGGAAARGAALEPLWPDRDRPRGLRAAPRGTIAQGGISGAPGVECGDAGGR